MNCTVQIELNWMLYALMACKCDDCNMNGEQPV